MELELILDARNYGQFRKALAASDCRRCTLCQSRTQIVVDRGNPDSNVLMIGEGPGANEDLQGQAFVGRAGKLLDEMTREAGFDTERDCLIANVVKCRPPENRQPTPDEAAECLPFLHKQIELMKPRFMVLLGATAFKYLIGGKKQFSMESRAGEFFEHPLYPGARLMAWYHPAYILRDPRKRPLMQKHIQTFKEMWDKQRSAV